MSHWAIRSGKKRQGKAVRPDMSMVVEEERAMLVAKIAMFNATKISVWDSVTLAIIVGIMVANGVILTVGAPSAEIMRVQGASLTGAGLLLLFWTFSLLVRQGNTLEKIQEERRKFNDLIN